MREISIVFFEGRLKSLFFCTTFLFDSCSCTTQFILSLPFVQPCLSPIRRYDFENNTSELSRGVRRSKCSELGGIVPGCGVQIRKCHESSQVFISFQITIITYLIVNSGHQQLTQFQSVVGYRQFNRTEDRPSLWVVDPRRNVHSQQHLFLVLRVDYPQQINTKLI